MLAPYPDPRPLMMVGVSALAIMLTLSAMLFERWLVYRRRAAGRFRLWQLVWHILVPPISALALRWSDPTMSAKKYVPAAVALGLIAGAFHLCFLVFVSRNPLYRRRFYALLRLKDPREGVSPLGRSI